MRGGKQGFDFYFSSENQKNIPSPAKIKGGGKRMNCPECNKKVNTSEPLKVGCFEAYACECGALVGRDGSPIVDTDERQVFRK
jgi:hypothetical protein